MGVAFRRVVSLRWLSWAIVTRAAILILVPVAFCVAVLRSNVLRGHVVDEQVERSLFVRLDGLLAFDGYVRSDALSHPQLLGSELRFWRTLDGRAERAVLALRSASSSSDRNDRFQVYVLPQLFEADLRLARRVLGLLSAGQARQAQAVYRLRLIPDYDHIRSLLRRNSASQDSSAQAASNAAYLGDLIGYGSAALAVVLILAALAAARWRSQRRAAELELSEARERYRMILETTSEGVWTLGPDHRTTFINEAMARMLGHPPDELIGRSVFEFVPAEEVEVTRKRLGESGQREVRLSRGGGEEFWALISSTAIYDASGRYSGATAMVNDITARKAMEERLQFLADRDPLTGVANRRFLTTELDHQLRYAVRYGHPGAVVMLDVDNFKFANDTYGHPAGDAMLKDVAEVLVSRVRDSDVVARIGGDEFALVLPEATGEDALIVARDIRSLLAERTVGPPMLVSIGIALFDENAEVTADELLVCADIALYEAKESGGDQARLYTGITGKTLSWVQRIRSALTEDRLVLYGQPIFDLRTREIAYHELLVRMLTEDGDVIPPAAFLPTAERFALIGEIDQWVVNEGLGFALDGERVTINLSGRSIGNASIMEAVRTAVARGMNPANVMFEVTETAAVTNITSAREFVAALNALGCTVALDDFGIGFGSFSYLKHIPGRYIKIPPDFVIPLRDSEPDQKVVSSITQVAHSLNKLVIAEGVENPETLSLLAQYEVDYAQGFYLGRPKRVSPPKPFERRLPQLARRRGALAHAGDRF